MALINTEWCRKHQISLLLHFRLTGFLIKMFVLNLTIQIIVCIMQNFVKPQVKSKRVQNFLRENFVLALINNNPNSHFFWPDLFNHLGLPTNDDDSILQKLYNGRGKIFWLLWHYLLYPLFRLVMTRFDSTFQFPDFKIIIIF